VLLLNRSGTTSSRSQHGSWGKTRNAQNASCACLMQYSQSLPVDSLHVADMSCLTVAGANQGRQALLLLWTRLNTAGAHRVTNIPPSGGDMAAKAAKHSCCTQEQSCVQSEVQTLPGQPDFE